MPDNLKGDIRIALGKIEYGGHQYENLSGNMSIKNRKVHFSNLSLKNAGATVRGSLSIYEKQPEIF